MTGMTGVPVYGRPALAKPERRLLGRGGPELGVAWGVIWR
jgi:hypothetical protein